MHEDTSDCSSCCATCMQALILCQRYTDAHSACESLLPGVDKLYLQAQAGWRAGSLKDALAALQAALALMQDSPKCSQLMDLVAGIMQHDDAAAAALEQGKVFRHLEGAILWSVPHLLRLWKRCSSHVFHDGGRSCFGLQWQWSGCAQAGERSALRGVRQRCD